MTQTYRRLIVELGYAGSDQALLRLAGEFALNMGLDLHALYIEDEALLHVAALPFAREIRLPSHQWQAMDTSRMEADLRLAADTAQRRLRQAVAELGLHIGFEVRRGEPQLCVAGVCTSGDIIVVQVSEEMLEHEAGLLHAAESSAASVLLVPRQAARRTGTVAVVAGIGDDAPLELAVHLAEANRDRLLVVRIPGAESVPPAAPQAARRAIPPDRVEVRDAVSPNLEDVLHELGGTLERVIVLSRTASQHLASNDAARLARVRGVPVLVL